MKYSELVNPAIIVIEVLLVVVSIILIAAFAINPVDSTMFTNALLAIMILAQLFTVNILINIYNKLGGRKK